MIYTVSKKILVIMYWALFAIAWFGLVTAWSTATNAAGTNNVKPVMSVPAISEKAIVWTDYNLIAQKIFNKFLVKYPNILNQVSCETMDTYINKILQKTKIKFRRPDVNKENMVKHIFEGLLRDYLNNNLECDDFIDVDRDETDIGAEEYVKCIFNTDVNYTDANQNMQSCYSSDGKWSCKGNGSCTVKVSWLVGDTITWKSSCGAYTYTTIDGRDDYAQFFCGTRPIPQPLPMRVCKPGEINANCAYPIYSWEIDRVQPKVNGSTKTELKKK